MATSIRSQDREQFEIVQQLLAVDGLHVAISSADSEKLGDYAGELARALAGRYGLQVEAYQPGRLETLVADLMLHRFDSALAGISRNSGGGRSRAANSGPACVLFIPDAQSVRLREFSQLAKLAAGMRQLRLVVMFSGAIQIERDARLHALEARLARWDLDQDDVPQHQATAPERRPARQPMSSSAAKPAPQARPWIVAAAAAATATAATTGALLLALGSATPLPSRPVNTAAPIQPPVPTARQSVQLAGEPNAEFRHVPPVPQAIEPLTANEARPVENNAAASGRAVHAHDGSDR